MLKRQKGHSNVTPRGLIALYSEPIALFPLGLPMVLGLARRSWSRRLKTREGDTPMEKFRRPVAQ